MIALAFPLLIAAADATTAPAFPAQFQGVWDLSAEACEADTSDIRIRIDQSTIAYWESDGTVTSATLFNDSDIHVTLAMSGEGEEWVSQMRFVLAFDGKHMFAESLAHSEEDLPPTYWVYRRCPKNTQMGWGGS